MLSALAMLASHCVWAVGICRSSGAMHRTWRDGNGCAAQRSYPRREENDGQVEGEQAAHHG
jgi:hypothetical protein